MRFFKRDREKCRERLVNADCWSEEKKVESAEEKNKKLISEEF